MRDELVMGDHEREVFGLLVRRGDVEGIQKKVGEYLSLALNAIGGVDKVLGRELHRLSANFNATQTMERLNAPIIALKIYLKNIL